MPRHPPIALKTLDRSHCRCSPQRNLEEIVAGRSPAQKDQLLEIGSGARLGLPIMCRRLSVSGDGPHPSTPGQLRKVMDLSGPGSECGTRTNLLFTMSCRTGGRPMPSTNLFFLRMTDHPLDTRLWWSRTGSNRRHPACKAGALPAELRPLITYGKDGGPGRT